MAAAAATVGSISPSKRIAVVTGGNKGIGLEICRLLTSSNEVVVVLTARDEKRGIDAVNNLKASGISDVVFHQRDVTNSARRCFLSRVYQMPIWKARHIGISGVVMDAESFTSLNLKAGETQRVSWPKRLTQTYETAEQTNYFGPKQLTQALIPFLLQSYSARVVNLSTELGQLKNVSNEWTRKKLSEVDELTEEIVEEVVHCYLEDAKENLLEKKGWQVLSAYIVSKAALNAYTKILAKKFPSFYINAVSPGFVKTDMSFNNGHYTVEEGARGPVKLALIPNGGPSGQYFFQTEESTFL